MRTNCDQPNRHFLARLLATLAFLCFASMALLIITPLVVKSFELIIGFWGLK